MDEEDIECLKESCLNDLFQDYSPGQETQTSSACQIQISQVFSLASPRDNNFNNNIQSSYRLDNSKQFDSEAILQNLPDGNSNVSSTTNEVSCKESVRDPRDSIKNDDGHSVHLETGGGTQPDSRVTGTAHSSNMDQEDRDDHPEDDKTLDVSNKDDDMVTKFSLTDVDSTKTLPDSTCSPLSPPSPPPAPVFKTDLTQFFSKSPPRVVPLASQAGQNVISVSEVQAVDQHQAEVSWEVIPEAVRRNPGVPIPRGPQPQSLPVKRKRGRPFGSKNKKKTIQPGPPSTLKCKRCFFLRKTRR